ncbi:MAG TPA: DNA oxidative demethylase AlkB [Methylophilus sp.]
MDLLTQLSTQATPITTDAYLLAGFALADETQLVADLHSILITSPPRQMMTPMGCTMSAAITNCGSLGWVSDAKGYRYTALNPSNGLPWPSLPDSFLRLADLAAAQVGFVNFVPDACIINQYQVGARMGLHQDKDELDFSQPIVSVSLGIPAIFQFGGAKRQNKPINLTLHHGDVVVWGGVARLHFHGIKPLKLHHHASLGALRYNLTFRKAG